MINWLERLAWRLMHKHRFRDIGLLTEGVWPHAIVRQACAVQGCGVRRVVYDDGRRVAWRMARKLVDNWPGRGIETAVEINLIGVKSPAPHERQVLTLMPTASVAPPVTARSAAIRRLEGAVARVKSTVRRLPDD